MPKVTPHPLLIQAISGTLGDLVFYRNANGTLVVQRKGERVAAPSAKQLACNEQFKRATAYANQVKMDPALSAEYRALSRGQVSAYHAAVRDFLVAPTVTAINLEAYTGQPGQPIRIRATDDTRVMGVEVVIRHASGNEILEQGAAGLSVVPDEWLYTTVTTVPGGTPILVEATATDRPGNRGALRMLKC